MLGVQDSYFRVRKHAGLFNVTNSYGRLFARGKDAIDLLHRMSTNDMKPLETEKGRAISTVLTNEKGRFVDLLTVISDERGDVMIVVSKGNEKTVIQWLDKFTIMEDAKFITSTESLSQFELVGPEAASLLKLYSVGVMNGRDVWEAQISETPATIWKASDSRYWIFTLKENAEPIWKALEEGVLAAGGAIIDDELFEIFRIEAGIPMAPNELNEKHNPLETALTASAISFIKGCYIGQEVIARLDAQNKVQRQLVGLKFGDEMPHVGDRISDESLIGTPLGDEIGKITSLASSPANGNIGLGYIRAKYANPGTILSVEGAVGNKLSATLVQLPFHV
jgi:folate-binding protein YgfZ